MTKQDIIEAAFRVWGRELYKQTSLTHLARDLGVTKTALYRHFRSKEALMEAMFQRFFDHFASFTKPAYDKAMSNGDIDQRFSLLIRTITEYFARYPLFFIFTLAQIYGDLRKNQDIKRRYLERGIDLHKLWTVEGEQVNYPSRALFIVVTITFLISLFHKGRMAGNEKATEEEIQRLIAFVEATISHGLGFNKDVLDALNYEDMEKGWEYQAKAEEDGLLNSVAEAVAEAGPWNASMTMIARRSGLSKSGLYAHFKNKQDMLGQLFITEFDRIVDYAELEQRRSNCPEERVYLAITAIAKYFRAKPAILIAMDWMRTRRLELEISVPSRIYRSFAGLRFRESYESFPGFESAGETASQWILFLIVSTMMKRPTGLSFSQLPLSSFRILYRFIGLGIKDSLDVPNMVYSNL